jgi:hypothetical protein
MIHLGTAVGFDLSRTNSTKEQTKLAACFYLNEKERKLSLSLSLSLYLPLYLSRSESVR